MKSHLEELLWRRADGDLSRAEEAALDTRLAADAEARAAADAIGATLRLLAGVASVEPPDELRARIAAGLARVAPPVDAARPAPRRFAWLREAPLSARLAYVAAGLLLGLAIGLFVELRRGPGAGVDVDDLTGAMGRRAAGVTWPLARGAGALSAARLDGLLSLELVVAGAAPASLTVNGGETLELVQLEAPGEPRPEIERRDGEVILRQLTAGRYRLTLRPASAAAQLEVTVEIGGTPALRQTLRLAELPVI